MKKHLFRSLVALLLAAALFLTGLPALADSYFMYVQTGNTGKLHLRALPTSQSESLGLYPNGTKVLVESVTGGWAYVQVEGRHGFMYMNFLSASSPTPSPYVTPTEDTTMYVATGNSGRLHLREAPSQQARSLGLYANGTAVVVTGRTGVWAFVHIGGAFGYMMLQFLTTVEPVTPGPVVPIVDPSLAASMVVQTGNSGKLHLRETPSREARSLGLFANGTPVQAVNLGTGWSAATVYGLEGYMMSQYLAPASAPQPQPDPDPSGDTTMYVCTGNSGKLHLRENASQDAASLGLYPNGTQVTVHSTVGVWARVMVLGRNGFMMRKFLSETAPGTPVEPVTPPVTPGTAVVTQPNGSFVYLRSSKSSASTANVLAKVPSGATVEVLSREDLWTRVRYNGVEGYMVSHYLK